MKFIELLLAPIAWPLVIAFYVALNVLAIRLLSALGRCLATWIDRVASPWLTEAGFVLRRQVDELTSKPWRTTRYLVIQTVLLAAVTMFLKYPHDIWKVSIAMAVYVLGSTAVTLRTLWRIGIVKRIYKHWTTRVLVVGVPLVAGYLSRPVASEWVSSHYAMNASNLPFTTEAATLLVMAAGLGIVALASTILMELMAVVFLLALSATRIKKAGEGQQKSRQWQVTIVFLSLMACFLSIYVTALISLRSATTPFADILLDAVAFNYDAASASRCVLDKAERDDLESKDPRIAALFIGPEQDKAVLIERSRSLFDPMLLHTLNQEPMSRRSTLGRIVRCFPVASAASGAAPGQ